MPRASQRRKIAIATWRAPRESRLHARIAVDATAVLAHCRTLQEEHGVRVSPGVVVGLAFSRSVERVPAFHRRVVFGRLVPFTAHDVAFAVDIDGGADLAPCKVRDVDRKTLVEVSRELEAGALRLRTGQDRAHETSSAIARAVPWFLLRPVLMLASLLNGGVGVAAFGQPAHPLGSLMVTNIGSFGLDEGYVAQVPLARTPLYVCVGAVQDAPMAVDGEVVVRPQLVLTLTADHRVVDGAHAAVLARLARAYLADPATLDALPDAVPPAASDVGGEPPRRRRAG